jgi:hypothetical protein
MAAAARGRGTPQQRAVRAIETWATRAILGRRLAYALIAEPVAPEIEAERLRYRQAYARVLADVVREGVEAGVFSVRDVDVAATALVGAMAEALVGPLAPDDDSLWDQEPHIIAALVDFCLNALRAEGPRHVDS